MSEREKIERAISALEAQRTALGDSVVETATGELREKLAQLRELTSPDRRQLVTVSFADVSGFTALSERLDPEEVQALLAGLWRRLDRVIVELRGQIDKHIGDAVMAVWGSSDARESDAVDAVRAALAMQRELDAFRREANVELAMRVGINTGLASISRVESTGERNVIGDTVNLASRLEHAAPIGSVLIGETTREHVRERFELEAQPPLTVKGKAEPVATYLVVREHPRVSRAHTSTLTGVGAATVGRETELGAVLAQYQVARAGSFRIVTLSGDAGIGKSRVLADALGMVRRQGDGVEMRRAQAWPETERAPFHLLRDLVRMRAGIAETASSEEARAKLVAMFSQTLGPALGPEAAAFVGQLLGYEDPVSPHLRHILHDPAQIRGRAEVLLRAELERAASKQIVVLALEDLHWADRESLEFLSELALRAPPWRLFVLASARPSLFAREGGFGRSATGRPLPSFVPISLAPLAAEDSARLARQLLSRVDSPPDWLIQMVAQRGGGNPFFCEELVRWLMARGVIDDRTEPWSVSATAAPDTVLPARIELLLHERIERLGAEARSILAAAAVIGATFWSGALDAVLGAPTSNAGLGELEDTGMIVSQPVSRVSAERQFEFAHALLREVTYEYTLKKDRRVYHQRAAEWFASGVRLVADQWAANVAWHFEQAGDRARAAEWYVTAAENARDGNAPDAAVELSEKALALIDDPAGRPGLVLRGYEALGDALEHKARYTEAVSAYGEMLATAAVLGDGSAQARALNGMSWAQSQKGEHRAAIESAMRAEAIARSAMEAPAPRPSPGARSRPPAVELANALHNRGWNHVLSGEAEPAIALGQRAHETARAVDAKREMALGLNVIGVAKFYLLEDYDGGARYQEQALALYREIGDRWGVACQLNNIGEISRQRGDYRAAMQIYQQSLAITAEIAHRGQELPTLANLGAAQVEAGEFALGEATLREVLRLAKDAKTTPFFLSEAQRYLARALLMQGALDAALGAALGALELAQANDNAIDRGSAWRVLGEIVAAGADGHAIAELGGEGDAEACFAKSVQALRAAGVERELGATYRAWASFETARGDIARAAELAALAEEHSEEKRRNFRNTLF